MSEISEKSFKNKYSFEERKAHSSDVIVKYPDRLPIVMQRSINDKILGDMDKIKYLVPTSLTITEFMIILRKRLNVTPHTAIYLYNPDNKIILSSSNTIEYLYNKYKNEDGFLYIEYCGENVFG
jgi:GABA(A) receptor-associated protein